MRFLHDATHNDWIARIHQKRHVRQIRNHFFQKLQSLAGEIEGHVSKAGKVSAWLCEAIGKFVPNRIRDGNEYNWDGFGCGLRSSGGWPCHRYENIDLKCNKLCGESSKSVKLLIRKPMFERNST